MLLLIRLAVRAALGGALSDDEIAANQLQVDSILSTINRVAQNTSFQGKKLLNGNYDYTTSNVVAANFSTIHVNWLLWPGRMLFGVASKRIILVSEGEPTVTVVRADEDKPPESVTVSRKM